MLSTHATAGQLTPGALPFWPSQLRVLLGHLFAQVVIKTQTEYELPSMDQPKKFPDLEAQKLACSHPEEGRRVSQPSRPCAARVSHRGVRAPRPGQAGCAQRRRTGRELMGVLRGGGGRGTWRWAAPG